MKLMKLIGSMTEQDFRTELLRSRDFLFHDSNDSRLLDTLRKHFPQMKTGYVLSWTPEQCEDFYCILVEKASIARIEMDRLDLNAKPPYRNHFNRGIFAKAQ